MARVNFQVSNFQAAEQNLQRALNVLLKLEDVELVLYNHYNNMAKFYLHTNLERAVQLLSALLSKPQRAKIPFNFQNDYLFLLGVSSPDGKHSEERVQARSRVVQRVPGVNHQLGTEGNVLQQLGSAQLVRLQTSAEEGHSRHRHRGSEAGIRELLGHVQQVPQLDGRSTKKSSSTAKVRRVASSQPTSSRESFLTRTAFSQTRSRARLCATWPSF